MLQHIERRRIEARICDLARHLPSLRSLADALYVFTSMDHAYGFVGVELRALSLHDKTINLHRLHLDVEESHRALILLQRDLHPLSASQMMALAALPVCFSQLAHIMGSAVAWKIQPPFLCGPEAAERLQQQFLRAAAEAHILLHSPMIVTFNLAGLAHDITEFCKDFADRKAARARGSYYSQGDKLPNSTMARVIVGSEVTISLYSEPMVAYREDGASFCPLKPIS